MNKLRIIALVLLVSSLSGCSWEMYFGCRIGGGDWNGCKDQLFP